MTKPETITPIFMNPTETKQATEIEVEVVNVSNAPLREEKNREAPNVHGPWWSNLGQKFNARSPIQRILIALALILGMGFILAAALIFAAIALIAFILRRLKRLLAS
jgi:hypothetical protein